MHCGTCALKWTQISRYCKCVSLYHVLNYIRPNANIVSSRLVDAGMV
jgi:hypothetical protein